jgi:hypothetical protein
MRPEQSGLLVSLVPVAPYRIRYPPRNADGNRINERTLCEMRQRILKRQPRILAQSY